MKRLFATLPRFPRPGLYGKEVQQQGEDESHVQVVVVVVVCFTGAGVQVCKYESHVTCTGVQVFTTLDGQRCTRGKVTFQ